MNISPDMPSTTDIPTITDPDGYTTLQNQIWPDPDLCSEADLYMHLDGAAGYSYGVSRVEFGIGGRARFCTYFNLFNVGKWVKHCNLTDLSLLLEGEGRLEISVFFAIPNRSWERIHRHIYDLHDADPIRIDLSHFSDIGARGILYFEVTALTNGHLCKAQWQTRQTPLRLPDLTLSVTTFKREQAVQHTALRFSSYMKTSPLRDHLHMLVVDNGQSADLSPTQDVTPIPNENLGGAGGFARGLLEARKRGASHCLFMDDDAAIHMESLHRTWAFLAYASNSATAVSGALANAAHRWSLWENGAIFNGRCKPLHNGTDLRNLGQVFQMELASTKTPPPGFYGGWWFFAFPLDHADHMPFPFFVRGDDISFSLVHDFNIVTLPGVMSFQDADFADKQSAQTLYLDLRNHLAHHLALPKMEIGRIKTLKIALSFFARALATHHYGTAEALNLAFEDVMAGPDFFAQNADMSQRRAQIKDIMKGEAWADYPEEPPASHIALNPSNTIVRRIMQLTLNGFFLPFFRRFGNRMVLDTAGRDNIANSWGAAEILVVDAANKKAYKVQHSKRAFLRQGLRIAKNSLRFLLRYPQIRDKWRAGYDDLTQDSFWTRILGIAAR
ncbi:MAG: hypothetical protein OQK00_11690 [Rhodobacteraceae bacterium]|nr:hypothetical protein [Paracoccaceae bacterium]